MTSTYTDGNYTLTARGNAYSVSLEISNGAKTSIGRCCHPVKAVDLSAPVAEMVRKAGANPADYCMINVTMIRRAALPTIKAIAARHADRKTAAAKAVKAAQIRKDRATGWCNRCQSYCYGDCQA